MINKRLLEVAVCLLPIVVISFIVKNKTNFNLEEKSEHDNVSVQEYTVNVLVDGNIEKLNLEDYIIGVVAGEMPASFEMEALKAQAVASRSYALYKKMNSTAEFDLTDNTSTQVYLTREKMLDKWGYEYDKYFERIKNAVDATSGLVATYDGEVIEAFYFAMSSGMTRDSVAVFGENLDYLKPIESVYDNESIKNYEVKTSISKEDFIKKLDLTCEEIELEESVDSESGYIDFIKICDKNYSGNEIRNLLNLRSANFEIETNGDMIDITTKGYGHGVGMSQYGANGYAKNGYTYDEIIKHYYRDVEIKNINDV